MCYRCTCNTPRVVCFTKRTICQYVLVEHHSMRCHGNWTNHTYVRYKLITASLDFQLMKTTQKANKCKKRRSRVFKRLVLGILIYTITQYNLFPTFFRLNFSFNANCILVNIVGRDHKIEQQIREKLSCLNMK